MLKCFTFTPARYNVRSAYVISTSARHTLDLQMHAAITYLT